MRRKQLAELDPEQIRTADLATRCQLLLGVLRSTHIVACALLEGAAFLAVIAYMTEGFIGSLGLVLFLVLSLAARFPTKSRMLAWVRQTSEEIELR